MESESIKKVETESAKMKCIHEQSNETRRTLRARAELKIKIIHRMKLMGKLFRYTHTYILTLIHFNLTQKNILVEIFTFHNKRKNKRKK